MRIVVFVAGMILAMTGVGAVSAFSGAPFWVTVLRVIGTAFVAQVLYLGAVFLMSRAGVQRGAQTPDSRLPFRQSEKPEPR
jgi:hypothetical protein